MQGYDIDVLIRAGNSRITHEDVLVLLKCCDISNATKVLEIGGKDGSSSLVLGQKMRSVNGCLWSIDPAHTTRWYANMKQFDLERWVKPIKGHSPWAGQNEVPTEIDMLFIDGDHRTRWAIVDYHFWEPRVKHGGCIVFHDWNGNNKYRDWIKRAVSIVLEDDKLIEIGRVEKTGPGIIAFQKP